MSLSSILGSALSGLQASQVGLRTASDNVANVNTPGYARTTPLYQARIVGGQSMGVEVTGVKRVADIYLQAASFRAASDSSGASVIAQALDRFQSQVGTLDDQGSIFSRLNQAFSSISSASVDPSLSVARLSVASDLQSFFEEGKRLSAELQAGRQEADGRISSSLVRVNEILDEMRELNRDVQSLGASSANATGAANRQSALLNELSNYIDIRSQTMDDGRVTVRTQDGVALLDNEAAVLSYTPSGSGAYGVNYGQIEIVPQPGAQAVVLDPHIQGGELRGLIDLRDTHLPAMAEQLAELVAGAADALNAAHNDASGVPAPTSLIGRNTGLLATDGLGFSGETTLAVTNTTGALVKRIDVDFDAGTLSVDGGAAAPIGGTTIADFVTALNTALGADGTASFANGALSISATGTNGVATLQDTADPSARGGRGFAHFFGLNDLVDSTAPHFFETGLAATDAHGFTPGETLTFEVAAPDGRTAQSVSVTIGGTSFNDILTSLNDTVNGLGRYATFSMDASGRLIETPAAGFQNYDVSLTGDDTERGATGLGFSQIFGVSLAARAGRSDRMDVSSEIQSNAALLSLAKLDITSTSVTGDFVLANGDGRGGDALQSTLNSMRNFSTAGGLSGGPSTLQDFAARVAGDIGARSSRADRAMLSAESLKSAADQKRADVEGVSLDEELANMTLYQQSYNASARLLQAAKELTDVLLSIV